MNCPSPLLLAAWLLCWQSGSPVDLASVLQRMDQEALAFQDMTASLVKVAYTAVLKESNRESGTIWMKRARGRAMMKVEFREPDVRSVAFEGTTAQVYYPKIQTVQVYDLGKNRTLIDHFSLLGFGTPRRELEKNYTIKLVGVETVEGQRTVHLELTPKSPKVLEQVEKVDLWLPEDAGHPVQQRFLQPGGDYFLITYRNIKLNTGLSDATCRLNLPRGVRREYPQR